jgi:hypothetical protein
MKGINMKNLCFYVAISTVIFYSSLNAQWIQTDGPGSPVVSMAVNGTELYAGTTTQRGTGGVYQSTITNPMVWTPVNSGLVNRYVTALGVHNSILFAGTFPSGPLYRYSGTTWDTVSLGNNTYVMSFASQDNMFFAGTFLLGVYRSSDQGISWTQVNTGMQAFPSAQCFALKENNLFVGTSDSGIYRSTNYGSNWQRVSNGLQNQNVYALAAIDTVLLASVPGFTSFMVYRSTNNGVSWQLINYDQRPPISQFAVSGSNVFGVVYNAGVFISTDLGVTWNPVNDGLPQSPPLECLAVGEDYIFTGASHSGSNDGLVYYRPLSQMITNVEEKINIATRFQLEQNYPNPFNPSTTIRYAIPEASFASIKVYDVLGNEVVTLVNEEKSVGSYEVNFNSNGLSSGIYFYTINAGSFVETKKMILMK